MGFAHSKEAGIARAKANARYFSQDYVVFSDTSGNWQVERMDTDGPVRDRGYRVTPNGMVLELVPPTPAVPPVAGPKPRPSG